ncbi:MAG TPA: DNA ligase D [Rhodocyclaceae bacterium]|nr:DNA ligase D [Rhodocyclaceae bacterium]
MAQLKTSTDRLATYRAKRNFAITSEPAEGGDPNESVRSFVIQKHWASRLHYDFRLELDGAMRSWAVPKGPSFDPKDKRLAVHVEDHPISYNSFEGQIPEKQYGAGKVIIWDKGYWLPIGDAREGYANGKLKFELHGHKLQGTWALVRMHGKSGKQEPWLLIKEADDYVRPASQFSVVDERPDSVASLKMPAPEVAPKRKPARESGSTNAPSAGKSGMKTGSAARRHKMPAGALKASLPATLKPQLATLVDAPPADSDAWLYEIKFDGYRLLTRIDGSEVRLLTRNGHDWTAKMPALVAAIRKLKLKSGWLDGEIVVMNEKGLPSFQALQNAFDGSATDSIRYFVFDLPFYNDHDLRVVPLTERRALLKALLVKSGPSISFSEAFEQSPSELIASACHTGLEGIIGKRKDAQYVSRRASSWIKLKCSRRQEFVIGGYTDPQGTRTGLGSLLLGVHDEHGMLIYCGNVGTGFDASALDDLKRRLDAIPAKRSPFAKATDIDRKAHWVEPVLLAEVSFGEWTDTGRIRHSVFHGLRTDKKAQAIVREQPVHLSAPDGPASTLPAGFRISNPDRVIDPSTGTTKVQLVRYYALIAPLIMEHLKGRPVSLVRAPDGIEGALFFQKHLEHAMPGVKALSQAIDPGHPPYIEVASREGLLSAAQMNVVEFHTWNAVKTAITKPDRMTFDLDPGEGVKWSTVQDCAELVRGFLQELGLTAFLKTSGGKGLHIVVPLKRLHGWDTVKDFSQAITQHLAITLPRYFVAKSGPKNRVGKIFVDYLRNGMGATTAAAWSVRSRPGLGISVPVRWQELSSLSGGAHWHLGNIHTRLDIGNDAWRDYATTRQGLSAAMKALGFTPA